MQLDYDIDIVRVLNQKLEQYALADSDDDRDSGNNGDSDSKKNTIAIGVGTSGGVDSQVLLHALCTGTSAKNIAVYAIYVNHSIRSRYATAQDVRAIRTITERYHIPLHVCVVPRAMVQHRARRVGVEAACREVRYGMYMKLACQLRLSGLLLGHHYDDHIESLWLQLLRGRRAQAIRQQPIAERSVFWYGSRSIDIYRPLLALSKRALAHYARRHAVTAHHDSTNSRLVNDRSILRRVVIKNIVRYFPQANYLLMRHYQYHATVYQQLLEHTIPDDYRWIDYSDSGVYVPFDIFLTLPSVVQCEMLMRGVTMLLQQVAVAHRMPASVVFEQPVSGRFLMHVVKQLEHRDYFQIRKSNLVFVLQENRLYIIYHIEKFVSLWYHKLLVVGQTDQSTVVVVLSYRGSDIFAERLCNVVPPCGLSLHRTQDCVKIMIYSRSIHKRYSVPMNVLGVSSSTARQHGGAHVHRTLSDGEVDSGGAIYHRIALETLEKHNMNNAR